MRKAEDLLIFAENLVRDQTGNDLSDLQQVLLLTVLQGAKTSYNDIAKQYGYSETYVRQDIAVKLWQLLTEMLGCKVSKSTVRALLERRMLEFEKQSSSAEHPQSQAINKSSFDTTSVLLRPGPKRGNILLVDDQPENLELLSHLLEEDGHNVQQAIDGEIALRVIGSTMPDLILLDIFMPKLDGYSVCQQLRNDPKTRDIPIIFVSALDEAWDKVKAFSVGGNDFIAKPFKTVEVLARVRNQLKVRRLQHEVEALQEALKEKDMQLQVALQRIDHMGV